MRSLIISDIHANVTALQAVLAHAGEVDAVWCLGDLVGYGPDPNECINRLRDLPNLVCLRGNHDAAALGHLTLDGFNIEARNSIEWLQKQLTPESSAFLRSLQPQAEVNGITLVHASPRQPMLEYLLDAYSAAENFGYFTTDFCFLGHTHVPVLFSLYNQKVSLEVPLPNTEVHLKGRCIANPGSVGQPRDRDPRAAYAVFDDETEIWAYRRVEYDVESIQQRMQAANLPQRHVARLAAGW
ncbi:MAG: metallophosphatase family protein [Chloroflexi bacterium]|nr:metallophosphatase family protein [Chloroflexota bacterium]